MMNFAPSPSTASSARRVEVPACVRAVARDVLDRPAEDLHAALLERHLHAAVVERADVGEGAGLVPQAEDDDFLRLGAEDGGETQRGAGCADGPGLEDGPALVLAHVGSPWLVVSVIYSYFSGFFCPAGSGASATFSVIDTPA